MKILHAWLIAICLSTASWSNENELNAKIVQFAQSPEWLGHFFYDGTQGSYTSLVESNQYFFSKTGKYNPEDELREVLRQLNSAEPIQEENYCHYIGRYEMVLSKFPEIRKPFHTCRAFETWSQQLSVDEIRLAFATGYMKNPASSFGHLFLKLVSKKASAESLNYAINFSAQTGSDTGALYALKGLFGEYHGGFSFLPYHQLIKDYSDLEGRDIWELDLNLDESGRRRLLYFIYEFDSNYIEYTFLNRNCAGVLEKLIYYLRGKSHSTFPSFKPWTLPIESFKKIADDVNPKHFFYFPSLKTQLLGMEQQLSQGERVKIKNEVYTKDYTKLNSRELDFVVLDKKINEKPLDENYYLALLKARSRIDEVSGFKETEGNSTHMPDVLNTPRLASLGAAIWERGARLDLDFLNEQMIHGRSLSEIKALNFHLLSNDEDGRIAVNEVGIFSFLAAEAINFLHTPLSYGGGIKYRDQVGLASDASVGYILDGKKWIYFPKLRFEIDRFHTEFTPEVDVLFFSEFANWKINFNHKNVQLEFFKRVKDDVYMNLIFLHDKRTLTPETSFGITKFF